MTKEMVEALERLYVWGFPYEFAARLRSNLLASAAVGTSAHSAAAPLNEMGHQRRLSDPSYRVGVAPNVDTLYSLAWLDLDTGPYYLEVPDFGERYYSFHVGFSDTSGVAFGQRSHGSTLPRLEVRRGRDQGCQGRDDALVVETYDRYAMIAGRILVDAHDAEDVRTVHALQDQVTLSAPARNAAMPAEAAAHGELPNDDDAAGFYRRLAGVVSDLDMAALSPERRSDLELTGLATGEIRASEDEMAIACKAGRRRIETSVPEVGTRTHGWTVNYSGTGFGDDELLRAAVAWTQIYITPAQEALYPVADADCSGRPLTGAHRYELRFGPAQLPPVRYFWSLTMYHDRGFLVANAVDRYAIGDRTPGLTYEPDGSLVIQVSHEEPPSAGANWLPAPPDGFRLMLRLYGPSPEALSGAWAPPSVVRIV